MIVVEHVSGSARLGAWWLHARRRLTTPRRRRSGTASSMSADCSQTARSSSVVSQSESRTIEGRVLRGKREKARIAATQTTARDDLADATARRKSECDRSAVSLPHESERLRRGAIDARKGRRVVVCVTLDVAPAFPWIGLSPRTTPWPRSGASPPSLTPRTDVLLTRCRRGPLRGLVTAVEQAAG